MWAAKKQIAQLPDAGLRAGESFLWSVFLAAPAQQACVSTEARGSPALPPLPGSVTTPRVCPGSTALSHTH